MAGRKPLIETLRLIGNAGAVEVHVRVDGVWRCAIKDRCGDTESCDHFVSLNGPHVTDWPASDWQEQIDRELVKRMVQAPDRELDGTGISFDGSPPFEGDL